MSTDQPSDPRVASTSAPQLPSELQDDTYLMIAEIVDEYLPDQRVAFRATGRTFVRTASGSEPAAKASVERHDPGFDAGVLTPANIKTALECLVLAGAIVTGIRAWLKGSPSPEKLSTDLESFRKSIVADLVRRNIPRERAEAIAGRAAAKSGDLVLRTLRSKTK